MTEDPFRLDGRVAIVTGASSGLGARFARVLEGAGATVVAVARRTDRLSALASESPNIHAFTADVRNDDDLKRLIEHTTTEHGRIDVLVNNAGVSAAHPAAARSCGAIRDDGDPAADFENQKRFTPWTSAWNVTGMPAASLPLAWTEDSLPVGVMLAARPAEEELLLSLCAQVEAAAPWHHRRPPAW